MKLFLDQKARRFIKSAASNVALQTLVLKRRDQVPLEVIFVENGVTVSPVAGTTTTVALKTSFSDANFLALAAPGQTILDLNTLPVEAAFSSDPASIAAFLEIRWSAPSQALRTATLQVEVQNSVILGDEATPAALPDGKATKSEAEAGLSNEKWMTPLRTAQAITALADATFYGTTAPDPAQFTRWVHTDLGRLFTWFEGAWVEFTHSTAASSTSTVAWTDVIGKPATFAPSTHTHTIAQVDGLQAALDAAGTGGGTSGPTAWADITGKPLTFAPSTHTHAISDTTGLQTALDGKAATTHSHAIADTTGLQTALDGKQPSGNYSLNGHTHTTANVTGLDTALAAKVSGTGVASLEVVTALPATLVPTTFYIVIPSGATTASAVQLGSVSLFTGDGGGDDGGGGGGGGGGVAWTPTGMGGLQMWFAAEDETITSSSGKVSEWRDKSVNLLHATQSTAANQPTFFSSDAFGRKSVGNATSAGLLGLICPSTTYKEVFIVGYYGAGTESVFSGINTFFSGPGANNAQRVAGNNATNAFLTTSAFTSSVFKNASDTSTTAPLPLPPTIFRFSAASAVTQQTFLFYSSLSSGRSFNGAFSEVLFFASNLSATDRQKVEGYLAHKWNLAGNLPADHPYKSAAPTA
jgi:hypothetical protein